MKCMICKREVDADEKMCPICGAMPWKLPVSFLNSEQHFTWLEEVYKPQLLRWEKSKQLNADLLLRQLNIDSPYISLYELFRGHIGIVVVKSIDQLLPK